MTQRNNFQKADSPHRADAFAAAAGHVALTSVAEPASTRVAAPQCRTRRAVRIAGSLPVEVRDQFGGREETRTQFLMARGAVLATSSNVRVGHKLTIQNLSNGKSAECHVISADPMLKDVLQIEVEFTRPQPEFWPVQFPAEDLKTGANEFVPAPAAPIVASAKAEEHFERDPLLQVEKLSSSVPILEPEQSAGTETNDSIVSLADSLDQGFKRSSAITQTYATKTATVDSVAQFRAANRAAHRHEQRMKTFYSFFAVVALAGAVFGFRTWNDRHPSEVVHGSVAPPAAVAPAPSNIVARASEVQPATPTPTAATTTPQSENPDLIAAASADPAPASAESTPEETQVEVRHGATSSTMHKRVEEEEAPLALPLRAGATSPKPEMLSALMAHTPIKPAVLAPQPPKRVVQARLIRSVAAQYPATARQLRIEGEVLLKVEIDAAGNVAGAQALSGPPLLRAAASDAVLRWKYQPATLGEKPVASSENVKVDFHLR